MLKRIVLLLALGAALVACSPSGAVTSPDTGGETVAPIESGLPTEVPVESPSESASPS